MARKRANPSKGKEPLREPDIASAQPVQTPTTIVFEGPLDIAGAGRLREQLMKALSGKQPVILDGANVERVDTAALQVLTAFCHDAGAQNLEIQWKDPAQSLVNAARLLGLQQSLELN